MRTARFWTYHEGLVKITLREGRPLHYHKGWYTDEGWSSESITWMLEDGVVTREIVNDGADCDGRLTRYLTQTCPVDLLAAEPAYGAIGYMVPAWSEKRARQRDYSAEAMGY